MAAKPFTFDGGAGSYFVMSLVAFLIIVLTLGIALPWAIVIKYRWRAEHTYINGQQLQFTGSGARLFGQWIKWLLLIVITFGIYSFWVAPRLTKWVVEHQEFESPFVRPATQVAA